jgi:5'-3' exonuclease
MKPKHLIIDATNLLYRANYVKTLTDKDGNRTSGIHGVLMSLRSMIKMFKPENVICVWDHGKSLERLAMYPEYKANRDKRDPKEREEIERQKSICYKLINSLPVVQVRVKNVEGDDLIAYMCEKFRGKKLIVSNDQDFIQLISKDVDVYFPNKKHKVTINNVEKFIGFPVRYYVLWKSIVGDASDNVKGFHGIGPVRATNIILGKLNHGQKFTIGEAEQRILDRNKYLITMGALLQPEQLELIEKRCRKQLKKEINVNSIRTKVLTLGFRQLFHNFDNWAFSFRPYTQNFRSGKLRKEFGKSIFKNVDGNSKPNSQLFMEIGIDDIQKESDKKSKSNKSNSKENNKKKGKRRKKILKR